MLLIVDSSITSPLRKPPGWLSCRGKCETPPVLQTIRAYYLEAFHGAPRDRVA